MDDSSRSEMIVNQVRTHLNALSLQNCEETQKCIVDFLEKDQKLTKVAVSYREWGNGEARFYLYFSVDNSVVNSKILHRRIKQRKT